MQCPVRGYNLDNDGITFNLACSQIDVSMGQKGLRCRTIGCPLEINGTGQLLKHFRFFGEGPKGTSMFFARNRNMLTPGQPQKVEDNTPALETSLNRVPWNGFIETLGTRDLNI